MTELLVKANEGDLVSLEVLDDVAVQSQDGHQTLVQSKSALTANPLSDRAIPFWKTLANWAEALDGGSDFSKLRLVIYVSNPRTGNFAEAFHQASTLSKASAAIDTAAKMLAAEISTAPSPEKNLAYHVKRFFAVKNATRCEVVRCFQIESSPSSPHQELPTFFRFIDQNHLDDVVEHALGWVKRQAELLMEKQRPAILSRDEFHKEMTAYIRKHRERAILRSVAPAEVPKEKKVELMPRTFVRQLEVVGADFNDRLQAVSDFFRATYDRTEWGAGGEIHPDSFDEFDDRLQRSWSNLRRVCEIQHKPLQEEERGLLLYSQCSQHPDQLENQCVPNHFVPGTFHHLADQQKVGWHPRYREVLAAEQTSAVS